MSRRYLKGPCTNFQPNGMGEVALFAKSVFLPYKKVARNGRTPVQAIFDKNIAKGTTDLRVKFSLPK